MYFSLQQQQREKKNSNNMARLNLQEDGPIIGRAYIKRGGGLITGIFFSVYRLRGL